MKYHGAGMFRFSDLERSLGIATHESLTPVVAMWRFSDLERSLGIATTLTVARCGRGTSFSDLERSLGIATAALYCAGQAWQMFQ